MLRVNGLFGWIEANDRRSAVLFLGFVAAFHIAAALALYFPLAAFDPDHAPVFGWTGYALRYVPLVTLVAAAAFALQMLWHVHAVRKLVDFAFVDDRDEPRLCRIVEPLAIGMGLPAPYVGVIESPALNAFACGIRRKDAVVVVTRGLLDGLDDDELAAVIAHELAHIAKGDIRLMAAANVCLNMLGWVLRPRGEPPSRLVEIASLPVITLVFPPALALILIICFLAQSALRIGRLVRMLISSSREFVADAASVEATQNPAALVAALGKVRGRSRIAGLPPGQDAMMIDGDVDGPLATHPGIDRRVAAIVAVTGSMALIAPARRDTRPSADRAPAKASSAFDDLRRRLAQQQNDAAPGRVFPGHAAPEHAWNWMGLTPARSLSAALAVVTFLACNAHDLGSPGRLLASLDPRPFNAIILMTGRGALCGVAAHVPSIGAASADGPCAPGAMEALMASQRDRAGPFGGILGMMSEQTGTFEVKASDPRPR